MTSCEYTL